MMEAHKKDYIRVSEVLSPYADFSKIKPDVLYFATERGSKVHALCAAVAEDVWIIEVPEYCKGYVDSFTDWFDKHVVRVFFAEERFYNEEFFYTGRPDLIVQMKTEELVLLDLKTPIQHYKLWCLQLAAYLNLQIPKSKPKKAGSLQLNSNGKTAKLNWYDHKASDFAQFLNALSVYRFVNG